MVGGPTSVKFVLKEVKWGQGCRSDNQSFVNRCKVAANDDLEYYSFFSVKIIILIKKNLAVISIKIAH